MSGLLDIFTGLWSIFQGMWVTIRNLFRPKVTVQYPAQRLEVSQRYRGLFRQKRNPETGLLNCTACMLCARACPVACIEIEPVGIGRERRPRRFQIDLSRCMYCHLCVEACNFNALEMSTDYGLVSRERQPMVWGLEEMAEGGFSERDREAIAASEEAERRRAQEQAAAAATAGKPARPGSEEQE